MLTDSKSGHINCDRDVDDDDVDDDDVDDNDDDDDYDDDMWQLSDCISRLPFYPSQFTPLLYRDIGVNQALDALT